MRINIKPIQWRKPNFRSKKVLHLSKYLLLIHVFIIKRRIISILKLATPTLYSINGRDTIFEHTILIRIFVRWKPIIAINVLNGNFLIDWWCLQRIILFSLEFQCLDYFHPIICHILATNSPINLLRRRSKIEFLIFRCYKQNTYIMLSNLLNVVCLTQQKKKTKKVEK